MGSQGTDKPQQLILQQRWSWRQIWTSWPTSPATCECAAPPPRWRKENIPLSQKHAFRTGKHRILFPHQNRYHEHLGAWDAVHYAFWSLVFRWHYFLSQSHCKETKPCYLGTFQLRDKVALEAGNSLIQVPLELKTPALPLQALSFSNALF